MKSAHLSAVLTDKTRERKVEKLRNKKLDKIDSKIGDAIYAGKYHMYLWFASAQTLKELQNQGYTISGGKYRAKISWEKVDA